MVGPRLVGTSPQSDMYHYWEEVGVMPDVNCQSEEFMRYETSDGRTSFSIMMWIV